MPDSTTPTGPTTNPALNLELAASRESARRHLELLAATIAAGFAASRHHFDVQGSPKQCGVLGLEAARAIQAEVRRTSDMEASDD